MKLQFDANQTYQLDAIAAVTDIFDGQPQGAPEYPVIDMGEWGGMFAGQQQTELGVGNRMLLSTDKLLLNVRAVQARNDIDIPDPAVPLEAWDLFDAPANAARSCPHFSVEMETGTGKTYVYLRTIFELSRRYGFQKFIIVVPSVAIREGVLKNIEITAEHFRALYNNLPFEHFVYDAKKVNRLRQFAVSNTLQILVINIDAFRKNFTGTEEERKSNVIYKESDKLSGRQPIEFVQAARPIVIIDEPQSVDSTEKAQEAIRALNPLCTLRYSATHRNPYNLVYRLDPVRAFELRLVKQIVVASAAADGGANDAFVRVEQIDYKKGIKAKLRIHVADAEGPKEKSVTVKNGADLSPALRRARFIRERLRRRRNQRRAWQRVHPLQQRAPSAPRRRIGRDARRRLAYADQAHGQEAPREGAAAPRARDQGAQPVLHRPRRELSRLRRRRPRREGQVCGSLRGGARRVRERSALCAA